MTKGSNIGKALDYALNQKDYLTRFLDDPDIPLDNNAAERAIRPFVIGKKNWHLIDTINGAKASAVSCALAAPSKANEQKPYGYFKHLLTEIPKHMNDTDLKFLNDLLPWSDRLPDNCRRVKQTS